MRAVRFPGGPTWLDVRIGPMKPWVAWSELRRGQGPREAGAPQKCKGSRPCLKLGGGSEGPGQCWPGGVAFSLLSARQLPESPLDVARMTQLPRTAKAR